MKLRLTKAPIGIIVWTTLVGFVLASCGSGPAPNAISGSVADEQGPLAGAVVRVQTTTIHTSTDADGRFTLSGLDSEDTVNVTAWKSGYYIAAQQNIAPGTRGVEIHLEAHADSDNPDYAWLPSTQISGEGGEQGCAECHSMVNGDVPFSLPFDQWIEDAHSQSATNPRFRTMYAGTDLDGNQSPVTKYVDSPDYGTIPLRPDPDRQYFGPGYKLDFPNTAGNCATCHTPAAAVNAPYSVDPINVSGVPAEGVPCDFCHKVWDVKLDASGLPRPNVPGVLSFEFRRPPADHQFFAGPLDDVAPGEDTYSPLQTQSQFCAPCHFGVFWDTVVYNSFGEWLESPYSNPDSGKTCQDCHMAPLGGTQFAIRDAGGLERDPATIFSHRMPGASDEELLKNAVTLTAQARREGTELIVEVTVVNDQTGHHVPTDSPLRHLILLVEARGPDGRALTQVEGASLPDWTGVGNPAAGNYAGLPGKVYAKILEELWTEVSPSGAYWNPTRIVSDNRLAAFQTDHNTFSFRAPDEGPTTVQVTLLFRRAFRELMDQKGWDVPDITMESETLIVR